MNEHVSHQKDRERAVLMSARTPVDPAPNPNDYIDLVLHAEEPSTAGPPSAQALIYVRVSSTEQEKEGFSIPAQLKGPPKHPPRPRDNPEIELKTGRIRPVLRSRDGVAGWTIS